MSNSNLANGMVRPRILYIATGDSIDAFDSSSCRINLSDSIMPEDGFSLVAGLRAFGFNAQAWNISEEQQNNRLDLKLTYQEAEYIFDATSGTYLPNQSYPQNYQADVTIVIPEGLYQSLEELFEILSKSDGGLYLLPSGFLVDPLAPSNDIQNIIPMLLIWKQTSYGFTIEIAPNGVEILSKEPITGNQYTALQINEFLRSIEILPNVEYPLLFQMLFTNNVQDCSPSVPHHQKNKQASKNPPNGILFTIDDPEPISTLSDTYTPWSRVTYDLAELGNEQFLDSSQDHYQLDFLPYRSLPWKSFSTPKINPDYLDIACTGLPTNSLTSEGLGSNLLHRQFLNGANQGLEGMWVQFHSPIWHRLENKDQINALTFQFSTEKNRWLFFNMSFSIEIVFFEVPAENTEIPLFQAPEGDQYSHILQQYTNSHSNPMQFLYPDNRLEDVSFSGKKKKFR